MKAKVDKENCIGCSLCASLCPEIFSMGDDGLAEAVDEEISDSLLDSAKEAQESCPQECIALE